MHRSQSKLFVLFELSRYIFSTILHVPFEKCVCITWNNFTLHQMDFVTILIKLLSQILMANNKFGVQHQISFS